MNKKNIFLWLLYDFANSIVVVTFFLYFSQWLVVDRGLSDFWFNMIFVGSTILLICTAPLFASISDRIGRKKFFLNIVTVLTMIFFLGASLVAVLKPEFYILAAVFFMLANYFYQFSFTFYNSILNDIAPFERRGFVSGLGQSCNWLGQIAGVLITLPFASKIVLLGEAGRAQTLLPATVLFIVLALPMLIFFKDKPPISSTSTREKMWRVSGIIPEYKSLFRKWFDLLKYPSVGIFLLAFFFFNDAILTLQNNFPIYLEKVFGVSDAKKSVMVLIVLVTAAIGAFVSGWVADRIGLKKTIKIVVGSWLVIIPMLAFLTNFVLFGVAMVCMGLMYGSIWAVARAYMVSVLPPAKLTFGLSFYTLAERFATFAGPLTWGLIVTSFASMDGNQYRIAVLSMEIFVIIGFLILRKIHDPRQQTAR